MMTKLSANGAVKLVDPELFYGLRIVFWQEQ
jgi:hypothetical protein